MTHDIFISHASADKVVADAMTDALESAGMKCWIAPRDIRPGDTWGGSIVRAIESSKMMVIIFSAKSNASRQVLREVERAVQKDVVLLPFRIEDLQPSGDMEYFLSATHWLEALTPDLDLHLRELIQISNSILNRPVESPATEAQASTPILNNAVTTKDEIEIPSQSAHPSSSFVENDLVKKAEPKIIAATPPATNANNERPHSSPGPELKLEARRTPPGTKAKHSKPAKVKSKDIKTPAKDDVKSGDTNTKKSTFGLVASLGLAIALVGGWYLSQHTDVFQASKPSQPVAIAPSTKVEDLTKAPEQNENLNESVAEGTQALANNSRQNGATPAKESKEAKAEASTPPTNAPSINKTEDALVEAETSSADKPDSDVSVPANESAVESEPVSKSNEIANSDGDSKEADEKSETNPPSSSAGTQAPAKPKVAIKPKVDPIPPLVERANTGDIDAILELSERFLNGAGIERNELESVRLLEIAANLGSAFAQNKLGSFYANGTIVPRNDEQALIWYTAAAEQGDVNSQYSLGEIYEFGFGAVANLAEAKKWYTLAAEQGHMKAQLFLKNFQEPGQSNNSVSENNQDQSSAQSTPQETSSESTPEI